MQRVARNGVAQAGRVREVLCLKALVPPVQRVEPLRSQLLIPAMPDSLMDPCLTPLRPARTSQHIHNYIHQQTLCLWWQDAQRPERALRKASKLLRPGSNALLTWMLKTREHTRAAPDAGFDAQLQQDKGQDCRSEVCAGMR